MSTDKPELSYEIVYQDEHLLQVEVKASNGWYAGVTTFYSTSEGKELIEFAEKLRGFPKEIGQVIEQVFGVAQKGLIELMENKEGWNTILSAIALKFFCVDKSGHTAVDIFLLEEDWTKREEARGKVSFELLFDPASLDQFVQELYVLGGSREGKATLTGNFTKRLY